MKRMFIGAALLLATSAAQAQTVEVATGDWKDIPLIVERGQKRIGDNTINLIGGAVKAGKCPSVGNKRYIAVDVPFLIQFTGTTPSRIVVQRIGCPEVESALGGAVVAMANAGEYRPSGENQTGWYRGRIAFSSSL